MRRRDHPALADACCPLQQPLYCKRERCAFEDIIKGSGDSFFCARPIAATIERGKMTSSFRKWRMAFAHSSSGQDPTEEVVMKQLLATDRVTDTMKARACACSGFFLGFFLYMVAAELFR
jgi:hypothetical protein